MLGYLTSPRWKTLFHVFLTLIDSNRGLFVQSAPNAQEQVESFVGVHEKGRSEGVGINALMLGDLFPNRNREETQKESHAETQQAKAGDFEGRNRAHTSPLTTMNLDKSYECRDTITRGKLHLNPPKKAPKTHELMALIDINQGHLVKRAPNDQPNNRFVGAGVTEGVGTNTLMPG
jgi:hypothetical protein